MDHSTQAADEPVAQTLEHEFDLVRSAIALVASGGASSVSLGSLRFGEELIKAASRLALASRVRITPIWSADEGGAGLVFEMMADG
jgi:HEAT repeat protein